MWDEKELDENILDKDLMESAWLHQRQKMTKK